MEEISRLQSSSVMCLGLLTPERSSSGKRPLIMLLGGDIGLNTVHRPQCLFSDRMFACDNL